MEWNTAIDTYSCQMDYFRELSRQKGRIAQWLFDRRQQQELHRKLPGEEVNNNENLH